MRTAIRVATAAVSAAIAATALTGATASAESSGHYYTGRVTAHSGLNFRYLPSTTGKVGGVYGYGEQIKIDCKVRSTSINGNNIWYQLLPTFSTYVPAAYVANVGPAPRWCGRPGYLFAGQTTTAVHKRVGPTTAEAIRGTLAKGANVDIICKMTTEYVAGNNRWYFLSDGSWVSAAYVRNTGTIPVFCRGNA